MHNVIIGTAGHVDHGKTCLIRALTDIETDRLKEEKKRGITIELGFADMPNSQGQHIGIIDVPGHERFVKNMLAGIGGIDLVLLVIAADEGVMPQTIEHFEILKMLEIKKGIVVITKADLVDSEWLEMVEEDVSDTVKGTFLEDAPIIAVSSFTGENIDKLKQLILNKVKDVEARKIDPSLLRIPIDRVFTIDGFGTVITGTLLEGSIKVGSEVQIYPTDKIAKVRNIQVHGATVSEAYAGQRTAVNLVNIKKDEVKKGDVVAAKDSLRQTMMIDVRIQMFDDTQRTLKNGDRLHLYYGSSEVLCKTVLLDKEVLESGQEGYAQLRLEEEIAVKKGDRFIIRFYSPVESIGGGVILDANPVKHKRFRKEVIAALEIKETGNEDAVLEQVIYENSKTLMSVKDIALKLGKTARELRTEIEILISKGKVIELTPEFVVHVDYIKSVLKEADLILNGYHEKNPISIGMQKGEFRKRLSDRLYLKDLKILDLFINHFISDGHIKDKGNVVAMPTFKVEYKKEHLDMKKRLEKIYLDAGYEPPELEDVIAQEKEMDLAKQMVEALGEEGKLKRLTYRYYMHKEHWKTAMDLFEEHMNKKKSITLAEYRDLLKTSRKYAVMILEYLDEQRITRLIEDERVLL